MVVVEEEEEIPFGVVADPTGEIREGEVVVELPPPLGPLVLVPPALLPLPPSSESSDS